MTIPSNSRTRPVAPLPSRSQHHHHHHPQQQSHLMLSSHHSGLEEGGDDGIVPSTPTLFVPRRSDGFGEAVSSPHVPTSGRFTFSDTLPPSTHAGSSEVVPEQTLEVAQIDDNSKFPNFVIFFRFFNIVLQVQEEVYRRHRFKHPHKKVFQVVMNKDLFKPPNLMVSHETCM